MAATRKPPSVEAAVASTLRPLELRGRRLVLGLSGGVDSVVLLHVLHGLGYRVAAIHVNHGLSQNAADWEEFCRDLCRRLDVALKVSRVKVSKEKQGPEAAARKARYQAFTRARIGTLLLAHNLDDQAETVLHNLLRGAGLEGASGMAAVSRVGRMRVIRPLLGVPRSEIAAYARANRLRWIEDESNANTALTRNFLRHRVGPALDERFPRWREALARAARHFASAELDSRKLLRTYLKGKGLRAPSEAKLAEMLRQLSAGKGAIEHDGKVLRAYRAKTYLTKKNTPGPFQPVAWKGQSRLPLPALGGELRFMRARGRGIDRKLLKAGKFQIRLRSGGERLQPDARRPRRTLKNLFQEAGVPPWERERLPLLYRGDDLVWAPGLGVDVKFFAASRAEGLVPEWKAHS